MNLDGRYIDPLYARVNKLEGDSRRVNNEVNARLNKLDKLEENHRNHKTRLDTIERELLRRGILGSIHHPTSSRPKSAAQMQKDPYFVNRAINENNPLRGFRYWHEPPEEEMLPPSWINAKERRRQSTASRREVRREFNNAVIPRSEAFQASSVRGEGRKKGKKKTKTKRKR